MNFGSSGHGSTNHLAGELFKARAGIDIVHIPCRGAAPAMNDLIAGADPDDVDNVPAIRPQIIGGTIRRACGCRRRALVAVSRSADHDRGRCSDFEASSWFGWSRPPKTPPDVIASSNRSRRQGAAGSGRGEELAEIGAEPGALSGAAFRQLSFVSEAEKWGRGGDERRGQARLAHQVP